MASRYFRWISVSDWWPLYRSHPQHVGASADRTRQSGRSPTQNATGWATPARWRSHWLRAILVGAGDGLRETLAVLLWVSPVRQAVRDPG